MVKCPVCNGVGKVEPMLFNGYPGYTQYCPQCKGTGEVLTEQEYIQTCNTEQLAEFLAKIGELDEAPIPCGDLMECSKNCGLYSQCAGDDVMPTNEEIWVEWLKQPHKPIS